jgi:hypothetical protein
MVFYSLLRSSREIQKKIVFNCSSFEATGAVLKGSPKAYGSYINGLPKAMEVDSSPLTSAAANFQFTANVSLLLAVTSLSTPLPQIVPHSSHPSDPCFSFPYLEGSRARGEQTPLSTHGEG